MQGASSRLLKLRFPVTSSGAGLSSTTDYEQYGYDAVGNRLSLRKRDGRTITYSYDALNRVRTKTVPTSASGAAGYSVFYGYDVRGLQLYARFSSDSGAGVTNTYDGFGRLRLSSSNMGGVTRTVASDYDAHGNRTRLTHPDGAFFEYAYDGLDRLFHLSENGPTITLASLFYDPQGRRDELARDAAGSITQYGYDPISRLELLTHDLDGAGTGNDVALGYAYNPASQIVQRTLTNPAYELPVTSSARTYAVNGLNQYTQIAGTTPATLAWDANGNLTSDGASTFGYDTENRLTSASGAKTGSLKYDPLGRLYEAATSSGVIRFVYDGDRLIAEYASNGTLLRRYVHGAGVDEPLVWYEGAAVSSATRRYLHANHQGSIVAVTGASGNTLQVSAYDPYGITNAGNTGRFQYTGQAAIPELGLLYYKARFYNPALGRFMQTDPIGYEDDLNLYQYASNDPSNRMDPTGEWVWVVIGAAVSGGIQAYAEYRRGTLSSWQGAGRVLTATAAGAAGGGAAGAIGHQIVGRGVAAITGRAGANAAVGGVTGAAQAEANARIESGGRTAATREQLISGAVQGAAFSAGGSAAGDVTAATAFKVAGGAAGEARVAAAEAERLVQGQGMPGGNVPGAGPYNLGPHPTPPSQIGEVIGQVTSTGVSAAQPPAKPACSDVQGSQCQ